MPVVIRTHTPADYPAIAEVYNAAYPADTTRTSARDLRHMDESIGPKYCARRAVLEQDGVIVGASRIYIPPPRYHPQKFFLTLAVLPEHQRRGLGTMLLEETLAAMAPHDPLVLRTSCCEDSANSIAFLAHHGFDEEHRLWESHLDVMTFDLSGYQRAMANLRSQGIRIRALSELQAEEGWDRKLYELIIHVQGDMPMPDPFVAFSFEEFMRFEQDRPNKIPEAYFVAVDGDRYIGVSILMLDPSDSTQLNTDDTGVVRDYRRRGIALALKLHGIAYAKSHGYRRIRTMNESTNQRMLKINERLGFVKRTPWIGFIRELGQHAEHSGI